MTGFSAAERRALAARLAELRDEGRGGAKRARDLEACLDAIGEMDDDDRALAAGVHRVVAEVAPDLQPRTWYGFPAYALDGKVVCFFTSAAKGGARYATLGFSDEAALDDGAMWPTSFALTEWTAAGEKRIRELVQKAVR